MSAESISTAQDIVESVCTRLEIKDSFGFALFIRAGSRLAPVGEGGIYLMDVYWQTERYTSENNLDPPKYVFCLFVCLFVTMIHLDFTFDVTYFH